MTVQNPAPPARDAEAPGPVRRPRSPRTAWAGLVAVAVLVIGGGLLHDVIAVRTGHPARPWRAELAHQLAVRHLDDTPVRIGAGIAVLLGLWFCRLALAPGLRRRLSLRRPGAVIDRAGVAALIADRTRDLAEVDEVAVRVRRTRTRVTVSGAADPVLIQRHLRAELARIPLAGPHQLDVRVRRLPGQAGEQAKGPAG
ncbi:DUF6286 domain-containing protein [Saccharothrix sp. ST-888]|uniref:DUF6286 domain-containing protein n=1 Tax=Saccharothrix sp. ST-888 TaxID=1427391 RepID=UPI0005EC8C00|nr:DUF6286 domain-containing protein [Saccharothrix sp. ST-888]KJK57285.1 hypothetical protein UK12_17575 [Saccharothrix sp. ST-888]